MDSDSDSEFIYPVKYASDSNDKSRDSPTALDFPTHVKTGSTSKKKSGRSKGKRSKKRNPLPKLDDIDLDDVSGLSSSSGSKVSIWSRMERVFEVEKRGTTYRAEAMLGLVQFISCLYVLPVVPEQMAQAGYDTTGSIVATATTCCIGCILSAFITNTPFIIAPPTSVSIFLVVFLKQQDLTKHEGNVAIILSGILLIAVGFFRPLSNLISRVSQLASATSTTYINNVFST
jgi:hypothetical protein